FSGPWTNLVHAGRVRISSLHLPRLEPMNVEGEWRGTGPEIAGTKFKLSAGPSEFLLEGSMQPAEERGRAGLRLLLREFTFNSAREKQAALAAPVGVWFEWSREGWGRFKIEPGKWAG